MVANILLADPNPPPPRPLGMGSNSNFSEHGHVPSQIVILGMGLIGQNSTFSEHGYFAYQIKGNDKCSNMQAHILFFHTPSTPWVGSKVNFFLKVVLFHIKLMGIEHRAPCKHILCPYIHTSSIPGVGSKGQNIFFY